MNGGPAKQSRKKGGNHQNSRGSDGSDDGGKAWETATRPSNSKQQRLRMSEAREARRGEKKPVPQRPALDFSYNPHVSEKFSTRRDGGGQSVPWVSENDHLGGLGLPTLGSRGVPEGVEYIPKNTLVSK